ncbi:Transcription factor MYC/MYB N-terminal [Spatholobus suberectus]|nr:Transcription factor MYC/MYB N-terminal [Spatholobus suberectus]
MVGSGTTTDRSKEAVGMMALHEALRSVCLNSDWTYSVFWTIRPRPRVRGGNGCKVGDDNGSLMLMWEDGFCRGRVSDCLEEIDGEDPIRKSFSKMSIQLYNYGEGLMGKVTSDKCHKWVFKEPTECEPNISNYWQSSFDALPPEWIDQFESGIQTIAVIQAGHGLLQLGSCKIVSKFVYIIFFSLFYTIFRLFMHNLKFTVTTFTAFIFVCLFIGCEMLPTTLVNEKLLHGLGPPHVYGYLTNLHVIRNLVINFFS